MTSKRSEFIFTSTIEKLENAKSTELIILRRLMQGLEFGNSLPNLSGLASDFKDAISAEYSSFKGVQENDAKELLVIILSMLDDEPMVRNPFNIIYDREFRCQNNHLLKKQEKSNLIVIPNRGSISKQLKEIEKSKNFYGENKLFCEECKDVKDTIMKTKYFYQNFLIFYISKAENEKNKVKFENFFTIHKKSFKLYAVICYDLTIRHFYEYEKASKKLWFEYNDSHRSESENFSWENAYLLFYELI